MGILKHAILPWFGMVHSACFYWLFLGDGAARLPTVSSWPGADAFEPTPITDHLITEMGAFHAALAFGCFIGVVGEHSHFRGVMTAMLLIFWGLDTWSMYRTGLDYTFTAVHATLAAIGIAIHSQEPGLFTKDKKAKTN